MKVVLDTNVFISGIFFTGPPYQILRAWREAKLHLCASAEILQEYVEVAERLASQFPPIDLQRILALLAAEVELCHASPMPGAVCEDPDDDKFLACAIASGSRLIVSGDRHLLRVSGYGGIEVIRPRAFVDEHLG